MMRCATYLCNDTVTGQLSIFLNSCGQSLCTNTYADYGDRPTILLKFTFNKMVNVLLCEQMYRGGTRHENQTITQGAKTP